MSDKFDPTILEQVDFTIKEIKKYTNSYPFFENWDIINLYLCNILGSLSDPRIVKDDELSTVITKFDDLVLDLENNKINFIYEKGAIKTIFDACFVYVQFYRIKPLTFNINIDSSNPDDLLQSKNITIKTNWNKPFISKYYIEDLRNEEWWSKQLVEDKFFTLEELEHAVKILNDRMEEENLENVEIYIIGGFLCLLRGYRKLTQDIDGFFDKNDKLKTAIYNIGKNLGNPAWLNNTISRLHRILDVPQIEELLKIDNSFELYRTYSHIKMFTATTPLLFYMKLITNRQKDMDDL